MCSSRVVALSPSLFGALVTMILGMAYSFRLRDPRGTAGGPIKASEAIEALFHGTRLARPRTTPAFPDLTSPRGQGPAHPPPSEPVR